MPYPAKLAQESILARAEQLVDEGKVDSLSLRVLATRLGVRAPSLYKYFPDKESLLRALATRFYDALARAVAAETTLPAFAGAYRGYALVYPRRYALMFRHASPAERPLEEVRVRTVAPLLAMAARLQPGPPLPVARVLLAYLHGAVSLELAVREAPPAGLDTDAAFELGLRALARGLREQHDRAGGEAGQLGF